MLKHGTLLEVLVLIVYLYSLRDVGSSVEKKLLYRITWVPTNKRQCTGKNNTEGFSIYRILFTAVRPIKFVA